MALTAPALAATRSEPLSYDLAPFAIALAAFALCALSPAIFIDGDTFTHLAAVALLTGAAAGLRG